MSSTSSVWSLLTYKNGRTYAFHSNTQCVYNATLEEVATDPTFKTRFVGRVDDDGTIDPYLEEIEDVVRVKKASKAVSTSLSSSATATATASNSATGSATEAEEMEVIKMGNPSNNKRYWMDKRKRLFAYINRDWRGATCVGILDETIIFERLGTS